MADAVRVDGLAELSRAFARADRSVRLEFRGTLRKAAEPVKRDAQSLALSQISHMTIPWSGMRIGVTRSLVYVAPKQRGVKSRSDRGRRRPKFADKLRDEALDPALEQNIDGIVRDTELMLNGIAGDWGRL